MIKKFNPSKRIEWYPYKDDCVAVLKAILQQTAARFFLFFFFRSFFASNKKLLKVDDSLYFRTTYIVLNDNSAVCARKNYFQMFVAFKLDAKVGICYHYGKPNKAIVQRAT